MHFEITTFFREIALDLPDVFVHESGLMTRGARNCSPAHFEVGIYHFIQQDIFTFQECNSNENGQRNYL
jgi:hypothetical protein